MGSQGWLHCICFGAYVDRLRSLRERLEFAILKFKTKTAQGTLLHWTWKTTHRRLQERKSKKTPGRLRKMVSQEKKRDSHITKDDGRFWMNCINLKSTNFPSKTQKKLQRRLEKRGCYCTLQDISWRGPEARKKAQLNQIGK